MRGFVMSGAPMPLNGFDVSAFQPSSITKTLAGDFAVIKATEGTTYVSSTLQAQLSGAKSSGKLIGLYHFADGSDVAAEAAHFVATVKPWIGQAILVLDFEGNALAKGPSWALAFLQAVKKATGVKPLLYGSASPLSAASFKPIQQAGFPLWVADYITTAAGYHAPARAAVGAWKKPILRQYTSSGKLPGYASPLDLDLFWGTKTAWKKLATPAKKPIPVKPAAKSYPTLHMGDKSADVLKLKKLLKKHAKGFSFKMNTDYGVGLQKAVRQFKIAQHMKSHNGKTVAAAVWKKLGA